LYTLGTGNFGPEQKILDMCWNNFYRFCKKKKKIRKDIYSVSGNYSSIYVACKTVGFYCDNENNTMNNVYSYMYYTGWGLRCRYCATSRKVPESIPGGVTGDFFRGTPD